MSRKSNNQHLLYILETLITMYPEQRFSQILANYGFIKESRPTGHHNVTWDNTYYEEPNVTVERVKKRMESL